VGKYFFQNKNRVAKYFFFEIHSWGFGDLDVGVTGLSQVVGGL
jgi:hypothetical protein